MLLCCCLQTLRIVLQAEGPNAAFFRPREAIVHRILNKQEDGVYAVLFYSVESEADSSSMPADLLPGAAVIRAGLCCEAAVMGGLCEYRLCSARP